ncbi:MAG TPA: DUF63 family protein [Methanothrix sp.]|nr:DUF63 family protein [Methanothrix sp.]HOV82880.1 DUF63 family protein [Methanothrix sp.]HPC88797.1 DUF63 family protein [Methanothrix sp.]HQE87063.1 DUF63 family protein [Methanothrix sp.]HQI67447.1 DUF63 family protein [Methanothrix sp.]
MLDAAALLQRYYIDPIIHDTSYNPVDTVTWAALLCLSLLALMWLLPRWGVVMDGRLVLASLPYILAGSSLRVIEDAEMVAAPWRYLLITPIIFFLVFLVTAACLLATRRIWGEGYHTPYATLGGIWVAGNLAVLAAMEPVNGWVIPAVFLLGSALAAAFWLLRSRLSALHFLRDPFNMIVIYAHLLDASSTYFGVDWFGYYEKHVVPTALINLSGTAAVMFPLKMIVLLPALYLIDREMESSPAKSLITLTLLTLGLAPAVRNTLRLALGI